tara:strand:+ start:561 stop:734 length:174 start_codon:yes stop_codon:yes gene_type:complete
MRRSLGSHACGGGCGKTVSANKLKCVECLAREAYENLIERGIEVEADDMKRLILNQT